MGARWHPENLLIHRENTRARKPPHTCRRAVSRVSNCPVVRGQQWVGPGSADLSKQQGVLSRSALSEQPAPPASHNRVWQRREGSAAGCPPSKNIITPLVLFSRKKKKIPWEQKGWQNSFLGYGNHTTLLYMGPVVKLEQNSVKCNPCSNEGYSLDADERLRGKM